MFRVIDNILKVFNHEIALEDGFHTIHYNSEEDSVIVDYVEDSNNPNPNVYHIGNYDYDSQRKSLKLEHTLKDFSDKPKPTLPRIIANTPYNNARVGLGPLFDENGMGDEIETLIDGIPIDFNYTTFFISSIQLSNYVWVGGRICNTLLFAGIDNSGFNKPWTARSLRPCYDPMIGLYLDLQLTTLNPLFGIAAMSADAGNWVFNMYSFVYQPYVFRRYAFMQCNDWNLFSFQIEDGNGDDVEVWVSPLKLSDDSNTVPNVNWKMSMFNLLQ